MEITIIYDDMDNEIYEISKTQLVVRDEIFKLYQLVEGNYEFRRQILKKDYKDIKKSNRKRMHYLIRFEREDKTIIKLIHRDDLKTEEMKQQKAEDKYLLQLKNQEEQQQVVNNAKAELTKTIRTLKETLVNIDSSDMNLEEVEQYNIYLLNIIGKIQTNNLKDISTTKQINKKSKIIMCKNKIHNYMVEGNFSSINQLCKDLKISRKSFYNYKLNEYLKELNEKAL